MSLIKNYLLSLTRNALRDKFFSFLNLLGLAVGLTAAVLIFIYIRNQLSYDGQNDRIDRIYRLEGDFFINEKTDLTAITQIPLGPTLKDEFPEVEEQARIINYRFLAGTDLYFKKGESALKEDSIMWADSTLFRLFTLPFIAGDAQSALNQPGTMVMCRSLANKYFGNTDVLGESIETLDGSVYTITGVIEDLPRNVHMGFNGLFSAATIEEQIGSERFNDRSAGSFWNVTTYSYILLAENTRPDMILSKFDSFYDKYMKELGDQINASFKLRITPLKEVHFQKDELTWDLPKGNMSYVYIMAIIGLFLVLIASINYTNLTTARAANRAKEIGVRKVGGATRSTLRSQFLGESVALALVAGVASLFLTRLAFPVFSQLTGMTLGWSDLMKADILLFILGISLLTGLLSGTYPAVYLSSFNPVSILKGSGINDRDKGWFRRALVIVQFLISAIMIIGSLVVSLQMNFIQNKDLGFDREQIILLTLNDSAVANNVNAFAQEIERHPDVIETAISSTFPGNLYGKRVMTLENINGEMAELAINLCVVNYEYLDAMGLELVRGRFYDREFGADENTSFVVNEALVEAMKWGEEALGKRFIFGVNIQGANNPEGKIIGVVKDFNYGSLHNPIEPLVLICRDNAGFMRTMNVRVAGDRMPEVLQWIEEKREAFNPSYPFTYTYLDEELRALYSEEKIVFGLVLSFTVLILFIAALGLLGLSAFMTVKRTRETGIRRVMGASQNQILVLFLRQFSMWVIISNLLAWPLAWFAMKNWLENFTFRINFPFWTFVLSLLLSLTIALLTVSWQSLKASRMNPAASIRAE